VVNFSFPPTFPSSSLPSRPSVHIFRSPAFSFQDFSVLAFHLAQFALTLDTFAKRAFSPVMKDRGFYHANDNPAAAICLYFTGFERVIGQIPKLTNETFLPSI
jgi:hypothetical protein